MWGIGHSVVVIYKNISDVNHCLLGGVEAACVDRIRLDAGCLC